MALWGSLGRPGLVGHACPSGPGFAGWLSGALLCAPAWLDMHVHLGRGSAGWLSGALLDAPAWLDMHVHLGRGSQDGSLWLYRTPWPGWTCVSIWAGVRRMALWGSLGRPGLVGHACPSGPGFAGWLSGALLCAPAWLDMHVHLGRGSQAGSLGLSCAPRPCRTCMSIWAGGSQDGSLGLSWTPRPGWTCVSIWAGVCRMALWGGSMF